jgi:flagellar biosynthesis protein FlhF
MQIQRVRGRDLREALARASELIGGDALLLSHERMSDGGVTVAVTRERPAPARAAPRTADAGLADVERALQRSGCSSAWIADVVARVAATDARGSFALDAAAKVLGESVPCAHAPSQAVRPLVIALVGPAGVGKTTTAAKLAARLTRAHRRVGLVALDGERPGAIEPLAQLARLIQAPFDTCADALALRKAVERSQTRDVVLVDTRGDAPADAAALIGLAQGCARATYLVVPATSSRTALEEAARAFADARPDALVVTKLDETRAPAAALEFASASRLPLALLCNGRGLDVHLHRADGERVADLFLRGRLAP